MPTAAGCKLSTISCQQSKQRQTSKPSVASLLKIVHVLNALPAACERQYQPVLQLQTHRQHGRVGLWNYLSKFAVGFLMGFPLQVECAGVTQLAFQVQRNVVEELPQHTVAEAIVVQVHLQQPASQ